MSKEVTIYIDWNLYSILKNPVQDAHVILNDFLRNNRNFIRLVYSPAHLGDLKKTSIDSLDKRARDLEYLTKMTKSTCIVKYWGSNETVIEERDAVEFFEQNEEDNSDTIIQFIENIVKQQLKEYGTLRDKVIREQFNTNPTQICNFNKKQLEELIKLTGISNSLEEFLKLGLQLRTSPTDTLSYIDYYYTAYTNLDLINYFPDSLTEKSGVENLMNDARHSAYGSLCDCFITNDNKCFYKSRFLFDYFDSKSKLIKTCRLNDTNQLINDLNEIMK